MSSSTFIQRWTSVNDLTTTTTKRTNSNNNKQSTPFFLRPQFAPPPPPLPSSSFSSSSPLRATSLSSILRSSQTSLPVLCHSQFEHFIQHIQSQTQFIMSNTTKMSSPIQSVFIKQWETNGKNVNSPRSSPIVVFENSSSSCSSPLVFNSKKVRKGQPIIICERINNHNRSIASPINSKSPLIKTWSQLKILSQQQTIDNETNSTNQTVISIIKNDSNRPSSPSLSCRAPRFARPTIASTQKRRQQILSNLNSFKRHSSPPSSISTFTRRTPSTNSSSTSPLCSINEDLQQQTQSETIHLDSNRFHNSTMINYNLPLRYKRESFLRRYG